jgi:Flp pilus assembly pilin Flp
MAGFNQHVTNKEREENKMKKVINYFNKLKMKRLMKYVVNEQGIVAIEYALIAFFIAVAIAAVLVVLGPQVKAVFQAISDVLTNAGFTG